MTLTQKETSLLNDLKSQEQLCVEKYQKYSCEACSPELKCLFSEIATAEKEHLNTVTQMLSGTVPQVKPLQNQNNNCCKKVTYTDSRSADIDKFLLSDMLAMEKHVSSSYDTAVFEFTNPDARKMLNHIQAEEQQHGEKLWAYMSANGFYNC